MREIIKDTIDVLLPSLIALYAIVFLYRYFVNPYVFPLLLDHLLGILIPTLILFGILKIPLKNIDQIIKPVSKKLKLDNWKQNPFFVKTIKLMRNYLSYFFLLSLIIIILGQFLKIQIINDNLTYITIISILSGFFTVYLNRKKIEKRIQKETKDEVKLEKMRGAEFGQKFPRINKIPLFGKFVKVLYTEGWWYSGGLILIIVSGFILMIWLAQYQIISIDEAEATNLVSLGFLKYGQLGTALSGVPYPRTPIFNLISTIPYLFFDNIFLRLRLMPVIIAGFTIITTYILTKKIFYNKKVALLSSFFLAINWYFISTSITARSYILFMLISFISLYILIKIYREQNIKSILFFTTGAIILSIINFFEGHSTLAFHIYPLLSFVLAIKFFKLKKYRKQILFLMSTLLSSVILFYSINSSVFTFIFNRLEVNLTDPYLIGYVFYGATISHVIEIGLAIIGISVLLLIFRQKDKNGIFLIGFLILTPIIQITLLSGKNSYPRYLSYILIPIIISFSYFIYLLTKNKNRIYKLLTIIVVLIFISSSFANINGIYSKKTEWQVTANRDWEGFLKEIPTGATVISDFPSVLQFYRNDILPYYLRHSKNDYATVNSQGLFINEEVYQNRDLEQNELFLEYLNQNLDENYIIKNGQEYHYTTAIPKVMNLDHLKEIIENSKDKKVYLILTHNIYEKKYHYTAPKLYEFIFEEIIVKDTQYLDYSSYSTQKIHNKPKATLVFGELS